ncbi:MAG: hypothetical protein KGZ86_01570 [Candidatus Latescibacteria bacterium]|nr:hypothetical protein [Candidatus Latescibacterota bacterium]
MSKRLFLVLAGMMLLQPVIVHLNAASAIYIGADAIQSIGRTYWGGVVGYVTNNTGFAVGYYYSPATENGTKGSYIPLYSISTTNSLDIGFGVDLRSIFNRSVGANKSSPARYAYELMINYHPIKFVSIGARYFWSAGGYFPKGLSLSLGLQTPNR